MRSVLLVVQCRFASRRLPGKALYPFAGMPMIAFLLRRLRLTLPEFDTVLATTREPSDDIVAHWAHSLEVPCVRGSEDDVLDRFGQCLDAFPARHVVRITGDNPLTDPGAVRLLAGWAARGTWDYLSALRAFGRGLGADAFSAALVRTMRREADTAYAREHINAWALEHLAPERRLLLKPAGPAPSEIDCSIDSLDDWRRVCGYVRGHPDPLTWTLGHDACGTCRADLS